MNTQSKQNNKILLSKERTVGKTLYDFTKYQLWRYCVALEYIEREDIVLDVGCGTGYGCRILSNKATKVYGMDDSQETISFARKYHKKGNVKFLWCDFFKIDYSQKYDVVIAYEFIEHIKEVDKLFDLFSKITKKRLLLTCPDISTSLKNPHHWRHYSKEEVKNLLEISGFKVLTIKKMVVDKKYGLFAVGEKNE